MGKGYVYKCQKCGKDYTIRLGLGMMFPNVYQRVVSEISAGVYGSLWKKLFESEEYTAVDASKAVYKCNSCGYWKVEYILDSYRPIHPEEIPNEQYGIKTVAEWGYVPYVTPFDLKYKYKWFKHFVHKCPKCWKRTHRANDEDILHLPCPRCKTDNDTSGELLWD